MGQNWPTFAIGSLHQAAQGGGRSYSEIGNTRLRLPAYLLGLRQVRALDVPQVKTCETREFGRYQKKRRVPTTNEMFSVGRPAACSRSPVPP